MDIQTVTNKLAKNAPPSSGGKRSEYRASSNDTVSKGGDDSRVHEILIGDKKYTIYTDDKGQQYKASRYNEKHKMQVVISFSDEDCSATAKEVQEILKSSYIKRILDSNS